MLGRTNRARVLTLLCAAGLGLGVGLAGCDLGGCPCGAAPDELLSQHDLTFTGEHVLAEGCACRCGSGPLEQWDYDGEGTCEHPDTPCQEPGGEQSRLECDG